jgi:hypothetical protein
VMSAPSWSSRYHRFLYVECTGCRDSMRINSSSGELGSVAAWLRQQHTQRGVRRVRVEVNRQRPPVESERVSARNAAELTSFPRHHCRPHHHHRRRRHPSCLRRSRTSRSTCPAPCCHGCTRGSARCEGHRSG